MPYSKQTWVDNSTPLSAARLNNMENGIVAAQTQFGYKVPTPPTASVPSAGAQVFTVGPITVPTNSRLMCQAKIHASSANGNLQTCGYGQTWTVTSGSTIVRSTYEHQRAFTLAVNGDFTEFDLWSRALIDTGTNTSITVTVLFVNGTGNNSFTLDQPEFFYEIGVAAP